MMNKKDIGFYLVIVGLLVFLSSCQMGGSGYMSEEQREELETAYDSLQSNYKKLLTNYEGAMDTLPSDLQSLYNQMQKMHDDMDVSHRQMMTGNMGRHMQGDKMMAEGMGMHMQSHMTGEWYSQMMGMHDQMARMHQRMGQQNMARMNRRLSEEYGNMRRMIPGLDEPSETPFNEEGDPALLNGENLYSQNCSSCHGANAEGVSGAFPPLVDSEWVTGNKSVPIRILLHGLQGEIEVQEQQYQGSMPSFKARLSAAEIAAILNYLRGESEGSQTRISQEDVIQVAKRYNQRTRPWNTGELKINDGDNQ
ncbi:Cytochrome c, mono-and diheme variants [Fodinibius roseus]|uniref:Cytochrome c, mono-and diheme variants n=1 Tax=Fodinibius roseus TaxID=1194090 RepID=A0A1M5B715_9BACT|nr:cytochrome c [Fodinibius roseus]SHF38206.1 Cytochrome c, mono-and diheme variants [Fodinibius roseus]